MSTFITNAFVEQYGANVALLSQQRPSRLEGAVRREPVKGKTAYFEQLGTAEAQRRTTRHGDSPLMNTPHARRQVSPADYEWGDLVDDLDKAKMLIDPASSYAMAAAAAMNRAKDDVIITAMNGSSTAIAEGSTASTSIVLPSGQKVAAASTGLTIAKLLSAKEILDGNEVDEEIPRFIVTSAKQVTNLLNTTEVKSSDYNTVKALAKGELDTFMGFKFIRSQRLGLDVSTSTDRAVIAWAQDGMLLGVGVDVKARITERADKSFSLYVYYAMSLEATRMEEKKVVEIACVEA